MRFIVVGAGAVGTVLGLSLEHTKHEVIYLVRPGRQKELSHLMLVDARGGGGGEARRRDRPTVAELGAPLPPYEWVLLCTRGDQIDGAIEALEKHGRPDAKVGVCAASLDGLARVRAAHPGGPVFTVSPLFAAWSEEPNVWRWFQPPLLKTLLSGEGEPAADAAAAELATALEAAKLPARAVPSLERYLPVVAPGLVLLAGWELVRWDVDALGRDAALRRLIADAMTEAARALRQDMPGLTRLLSYAPAPALSLALAALPRLTTANLRALWTHHGPKIQQQTHQHLDQLIARIGDRKKIPRLLQLRSRLQ